MGPYTVSDGKFTYEYSVDGENRERQKDALKFLKDWATAFLTLETAMLTLIAGVLIGVRELSLTLSLVESAILLAAVPLLQSPSTTVCGYYISSWLRCSESPSMMPQRQKISIRSAWRQTLRGLKSWLYRFERGFNGA